MPNQDAIDGIAFNALAEGLFAHYVGDGRIDHARWLRTHAEGGFVGTCRLLRQQPTTRTALRRREDHLVRSRLHQSRL